MDKKEVIGKSTEKYCDEYGYRTVKLGDYEKEDISNLFDTLIR